MTDINARIAKANGGIAKNTSAGHTYWINDEYPRGLTQCPQYSTDWRLAGELIVEMATNNDGKEEDYNEVIIWKNITKNKWYCELSCLWKPLEADTPQMAICLAFLEWNGE